MALSMRVLVQVLVLVCLTGCAAKKPAKNEQDPILQRLEELERRVSEQDKDLKRQKDLEKRVNEQDRKLLEQDAKLILLDTKLQRQEEEIQSQKQTILKLDSELQQLKTKGQTDIKLQRQEQEIQDRKETILNLDSELQQLKTKQHASDGPGFTGQHVPDKEIQKRSDDTSAWEPVVSQMSSQMTQMNAEIQVLKTVNQQQDQRISQSIGTSYVRWGHGSCPNSSEILYSGTIGGSWYNDAGAASNYLCLPPDPVFGGHSTSGARSHLFGSEYDIHSEPTWNLVPRCAVCRIPRSASVMVPAVNTCRPGWTLEYSGYLMAGLYSHTAASEYICVDSSMEYVPGTQADDDGKMLYYTKTYCGSLPCPPYVNDKVVFCTVCSK